MPQLLSIALRICVRTECVLEPVCRAGFKTQVWFYEQVYCYIRIPCLQGLDLTCSPQHSAFGLVVWSLLPSVVNYKFQM